MTHEGHMTGHERITEDPTAQLSPTARKLVAAARRLLARGGYEALTVEAVAAEAGAVEIRSTEKEEEEEETKGFFGKLFRKRH